MLDKLSDALKSGMRKFISAIFIDETTLNAFVNDMQRALLQADVEVKLVFKISEDIKKRAKEEIGKGQVAKEHIIKIVYEELVKVLGEQGSKIELRERPYKILLLGLFGNGKTTTAGKLAKYYLNRGKKVCLLALDTFRAAAYEQLMQIGAQIKVPVFGDPSQKNPEKVIDKFKHEFDKYDVIIADSAGRNALSKEMIDEITGINKVLKPQEVLLVQGADIGQNAKEQATAFRQALNISGVIITKLDGTAKGGGAITATTIAHAPVKFLTVGEKVDDLEEFEPKRFVSRILGMGDIETLLEKAQELQKEQNIEKDMEERLKKGEFNLKDYRAQLNAMKKMGSLSKLINMIPGLGMAGIPKDMLDMQEGRMKVYNYVLDSMTQYELENPDKINASRIARIAAGSGTSEDDVRELLKQYKQIKAMMKGLKGKDLEKMSKRMGKGALKGMPLPKGFKFPGM
ncbi:MAG: signal recognition particle receptor subunit alpha [Candidatus Nanoarchaeia archaeon]|nr:signal recognition particle receptor subunit alpha [Candidatus Nanoarchaeia archaeon]MDD5239600.1 signal recognition particle receptor subunit alpha [Candidatus Nanoarchaeia archaeon]